MASAMAAAAASAAAASATAGAAGAVAAAVAVRAAATKAVDTAVAKAGQAGMKAAVLLADQPERRPQTCRPNRPLVAMISCISVTQLLTTSAQAPDQMRQQPQITRRVLILSRSACAWH